MFHLVNRTYLEYDFKFTVRYPYLVASERWTTHPIINANPLTAEVEPTFEELLEKSYNNDLDGFWNSLVNKNDKLVLYVDPFTFTRLQVQYWKSIYPGITVENCYFLYTTYIESVRLGSYFFMDSNWDPKNEQWNKDNVLSEVKRLPKEAFSELFEKEPEVAAIKAMDKRKLSFEYLLLDYFSEGGSKFKEELLNRIKVLTWENWLDELEHLKYEILSGNIDASKLDPTIETPVGGVEEGLAKSKILSWTVDPLFNNNIDYIRQTYDHNIFIPCWQRLADQWGIGYDDMDELNEMINNDDYEGLLLRDIGRNYGCSYTRTRFMTKANQVLTTWCYEQVRNQNVEALKPFKLV